MGCHITTTQKKMNSLQKIIYQKNMNQLIDMWPSTYLYMLKSKFQAVSTMNGLDHNGFRKLFPKLKSESKDFSCYQETSFYIFQCFDLDKNGKLDFKEFCLMLSLISNSDENDRIVTLFYFYDQDQDLILSKQEMDQFIQENHQFVFNQQEQSKGMKLDEFRLWIESNFNVVRYFEIFELVPGPLKERERMRELLQNKNPGKYYVISYKWWELWRIYINYNFAQNPNKKNRELSIIDLEEQPKQLSRKPSDQQGLQGSMMEEMKSDPNNPKLELKHGICDSAYNQAVILPLEDPQTLRPGPIDNSDIQGEFEGELRQNILNNHDYLILPEQAWMSLVQWYGCVNNLSFKRRDFLDPKHKIKIVDLFPPLLRGFKTNQRGEIKYRVSHNIMVSLRKQFKDVARKLAKRFKISNSNSFNLFYKKVGEPAWSMVVDMEQTLLEREITSGTFILIVPKGKKPFINTYQYEYELGQIYDVQHPYTNEWLLCHICNFTDDFISIRMHIQRESYTREFNICISERLMRINPPNTKKRSETYSYFIPNLAGLYNLGNTCFMNTVIQCLVHTPLFDEYLIKQTFKADLKKNQRQGYLIEELSKLALKLQTDKIIGPESFKKAIDIILPQFSGYEQHDAQEFLNILLDNMSDEIKKNHYQNQINNSFTEHHQSVIKELFNGKFVNILKCQQCQTINQKVEDFYTLSLPIPLNDEINLNIIFVRKCTKENIYPLRKYGVKVSKYGTVRDLQLVVEKVTNVSCQRFELAEIYRSAIHRLFLNYDPKTPLRQLGFTGQSSQIYAYEIARTAKEVEDDYRELVEMTFVRTKDFQNNDYVDVEDKQGEWRHGLIAQVFERNQEKNFRVMIKHSPNLQQCYFFHIYQLAPFRTKVQTKLKLHLTNVIHRIQNQNTDCMDRFATPFLIIIPTFHLTWFELQVLVYNQAKKFIDFEYVKKKKLMQKQSKESRQLYRNSYDSVQDDLRMEYTKKYNSITKTPNQNQRSQRKTEQDLEDYKTRLRKPSYSSFQEEINFIKEPDFPYKLRLLDQNSLFCLACDKQTNVKGKHYTFCPGCEVDPVFLNIQTTQSVVIALDWIDSLAFNPHANMPEHDQSYIQIIEEKRARKDRIVPEQCFSLLTQEEKVEIHCDKCDSQQQMTTRLWLDHTPNILIVHLKRFQFRDGFLEKIESDINFPFKQLNLKQWQNNQQKDRYYDLYAVANHFGSGLYGHYTAYIMKIIDGKEVWIHFDDDQIRTIPQEKILSQYAYLLFYRRREFPTSAILNLTYKN